MTVADLQLPISVEKLRRILRSHGVVRASVFGSYARGEAAADSDLDLFVKLDKSRSLFDLGALQYQLEQETKKKVDVATRLHPRFEPFITPDLVEVL